MLFIAYHSCTKTIVIKKAFPYFLLIIFTSIFVASIVVV